jgi:hypothetical protein
MAQIREYHGEKHLILGCGNHPHIKHIPDHWLNEHQHIGEYTVDIDNDNNPSCLADFDKDKLTVPDQNAITLIVAEGVLIDIQSDIFVNEISRICKGREDKVQLDLVAKSIGAFRSWKGCWSHTDPTIKYGFYSYQSDASGFIEWIQQCREKEKQYIKINAEPHGGCIITYRQTGNKQYQAIDLEEELMLTRKCKESYRDHGKMTDKAIDEIGDIYVQCADGTYKKVTHEQLYPVY